MKYPLWVAAAVISVYALALATSALQSPDEKLMSRDQKVIDRCWHESRGTALTATQQQVVIGACQRSTGATGARTQGLHQQMCSWFRSSGFPLAFLFTWAGSLPHLGDRRRKRECHNSQSVSLAYSSVFEVAG